MSFAEGGVRRVREIKEGRSELIIPVDQTSLSPPQVRLMKSFNVAILKALTTQREDQFFKNCEEAMKVFASMAGQSCFAEHQSKKSSIPYARQAVEMAIESLLEHLGQNLITRHDN